MDLDRLRNILADLNLGANRSFDSLDSTNDEAMRWAEEGAPDMSLVVANEQTAGRGREGRIWHTVSGASLAFSLILYPLKSETTLLPRLTALGALAVQSALHRCYGLTAQIKWPNDVLLDRKKVAGVLAEAHWSGDNLKTVILGVGVNIASDSIRFVPSQGAFPPTCMEAVLGYPVDPSTLLHEILVDMTYLRSRLDVQEFMQAWERNLAFHGEWVQIFRADGLLQQDPRGTIEEGRVVGLAPDGSLKLRDRAGELIEIQFGEVRLRPVSKTT